MFIRLDERRRCPLYGRMVVEDLLDLVPRQVGEHDFAQRRAVCWVPSARERLDADLEGPGADLRESASLAHHVPAPQ